MTTHNESYGEEPSEQITVNAGDTPQTPKEISDYTAEELLEALNAGNGQADAPAAPQPPPTESEKPSDDGTKAADDGQHHKAIRIRLNALPEDQQAETVQAVNMVRDGKATDLLDALSQLRGTTQATTKPKQYGQTETPPSEPELPVVQQIEAQIKELRAERKAAKAEYDGDKEDELTEQIEDLTRQLAREEAKAELAAEKQREQANSFEQAYNVALDELDEKFPDVLDHKSEFTRLLTVEMDAAEHRKDAGLNDPRFILKKAAEVHALLNRPSGVKPSAPPAQPRATGANVARPSIQSSAPSPEQFRMALENSDPADILLALEQTR